MKISKPVAERRGSCFESFSRRRKIQEENPELAGEKTKRLIEEKKFDHIRHWRMKKWNLVHIY